MEIFLFIHMHRDIEWKSTQICGGNVKTYYLLHFFNCFIKYNSLRKKEKNTKLHFKGIH